MPAKDGKIGLVNLGVLFRDQEKVKILKAQLDVKSKPYKDRQDQLEKEIAGWNAVLRDTNSKLSEAERENGYKELVRCRRQMNDLEADYHNKMGNELGGEVAALDREIRQAIKVYAELNGYQLIIGYGEPETPLPRLAEYQRTMTAIDAGHMSFVPIANTPDITRGVLDLLNSTYRAAAGRK
jgi:Skp family chaperone for outer membrane proteins